jgi:hemerythrin-like domain-containing protein
VKPTNILLKEHLIIEQVLNCLETIVERCDRQSNLEARPAQEAIVFFRAFAERCHHSKVEKHLLPAMQAAGVSTEGCVDCPMLHRQEESRVHLDNMEAAIEPASAGDGKAVAQFTKHARAYIELLLEYIARAEDCLFPLINRTLRKSDKSQLMARLQDSNGENVDRCTYKRYIDIANRLADQLNVPRAAVGNSSGDPG